MVLVDVVEGMPQGKALDLMQARPVFGFNAEVVGTNDYAATKDSQVVIITAGIARKPGMSREDLINTNKNIVATVTKEVMAKSPDAFLIIVSNPLDAMCYVAKKVSGLPGAGHGYGGHPEDGAFPLLHRHGIGRGGGGDRGHGPGRPRRRHGAGGQRHQHLRGAAHRPAGPGAHRRPVDRTCKGGGEIVALLKTVGFYAPAAAAVQMAESILKDQRRLVPGQPIWMGSTA